MIVKLLKQLRSIYLTDNKPFFIYFIKLTTNLETKKNYIFHEGTVAACNAGLRRLERNQHPYSLSPDPTSPIKGGKGWQVGMSCHSLVLAFEI